MNAVITNNCKLQWISQMEWDLGIVHRLKGVVPGVMPHKNNYLHFPSTDDTLLLCFCVTVAMPGAQK